MPDEHEEWRPGSFTKNFSWGPSSHGLFELHRIIRIGFDSKMQDVPRQTFRERVAEAGRPDFIPINFFLFNRPIDGIDYILADELVFEALSSEHSERFDKLALFTFNLSYAGKWAGARQGQRRPALWANEYIWSRVAEHYRWDTKRVDADDIEAFVASDPRYTGATVRKLATNLNYLYSIGSLSAFPTSRVERWWVDALFLALDRIIENRVLNGLRTPESSYISLLSSNHFLALSGGRSLEKEIATRHLVRLYVACGGRDRFSIDDAMGRTKQLMPEVRLFLANDPRPRGAVYPTNPAILKSIPPVCAMLARYAGFEVLDPDELENFDLERFVRERTLAALDQLQAEGVRPTMSVEELMKITREK